MLKFIYFFSNFIFFTAKAVNVTNIYYAYGLLKKKFSLINFFKLKETETE